MTKCVFSLISPTLFILRDDLAAFGFNFIQDVVWLRLKMS